MKKAMFYALGIILVLLMAIGLTACASSNPGQQGQPSQPTQQSPQGQPSTPPTASNPATPAPVPTQGPEYGGIFRISTGADTAMALGFPWEHQVLGSQGHLAPFVEPLLEARQDGTFGYSLAVDYQSDVEKLQIIFTLRQGVTFSDGSPWNAETAAWVLTQQMEANEMNPAVIGYEVRDEYTFVVQLNQYLNSIFPIFSNRPFSMISRENYEKNGRDYARVNPVGTGPFTLKEQVPGSHISFERRDDYWREGMPYLDGIEYVQMTDVMTQNAAMMSTGPDALDELTTGNFEQVALLRDQAPVYVLTQQGGYSSLIPGSRNEGDPLALVDVRKAVSFAIDRVSLVEARGFGISRPATQIIAEGFVGHIPDASLNVSYDPVKSKELLASSGYPNGFDTVINVMPGADRDAAVAIQSMLAEVGINARLDFPEAGAATEMRSGYWEGFMYTGIGNFANSGTTIRLHMDPNFQYMPTMWRPADEMRSDYDNLRAASTYEDEELYAMRINQLFLENMVTIPIVDSTTCFIIKNNVYDTAFAVHTPQTVWLPYQTWKSATPP